MSDDRYQQSVNVRYVLGRALSPAASLKFDAQSQHTMNADVLIALAWVNRTVPKAAHVASLMLRVKFGLVWEDVPELFKALRELARDVFLVKGWLKKDGGDLLDKFTQQIIIEWMDGVCRECLGLGRVSHARNSAACKVCNGTSRHRASGHERAEALGFSEFTYRNHKWADRFYEVRERIDEIERRACSKMRYHLVG